MGIDFINKVKDTYKKSWAQGADRVKTHDLSTIKPEEVRTILAKPVAGYCPSANHKLELQLVDDSIEIYLHRNLVGISSDVPPSILASLLDVGGKTIGFVHRIRAHSGLIDVAIWVHKHK